MSAYRSARLETVQWVHILNAPAATVIERGCWLLQGFTSNVRAAVQSERSRLKAMQRNARTSAGAWDNVG